MFKNMKLSMKISAGFFLLLVISLIMGGFAWQGLGRILQLADINEGGIQALSYMNQCATTRRDFAIHGFNVPEEQTKNAADLFREAHSGFTSALAELVSQPRLHDEDRRLVTEVQRSSEQYLEIFGRTVAAQQTIGDAFAVWRQNGNTITQTINGAIDNVLTPEMKGALDNKNLEEYAHFAAIRNSLNEDVIALVFAVES